MVKAEWDEWLLHPVTQEFRKAIKGRIQELKDQWANGAFSTESLDGTKQLNAEAIGKVQMLQDLLEATYESVTEDNANGKSS